MIFKTKIASLLLLVTILKTYASEPLNKQTPLSKVVGSIAQSKPVYLFEKYILFTKVRQVNESIFGNEMASQKYQDLGKEAQCALRIPEDRHVPIKKIKSTSLLSKLVSELVSGMAFPDAIYVNEEKLNQQMYGSQRCVLFHEVIHKKYHDFSTDSIVKLILTIASSIGAHKLIKAIRPQGRFKILHVIGVFAAGVLSTAFFSTKYHKYFERRADIEGHYATQCSICVQESANRKRQSFEQENHPWKNNGYLWASDLEKIAQDLSQQNNICVYHKNKESLDSTNYLINEQ